LENQKDKIRQKLFGGAEQYFKRRQSAYRRSSSRYDTAYEILEPDFSDGRSLN